MTTENFDLKVGDVIVGNDGMGDRIGYYMYTKTDKNGIWVYYGNIKEGKSTKEKVYTRAVYSKSINHIRLATPEEIFEYENR